VSLMDHYALPIHGLKEGKHEYEFEADAQFFEYFENADITGGDLKITLILDKKSQFMQLDFHINGYIRTICDRCLDDFDYPVNIHEQLFVRFGEDAGEISDNVIVIPREESRLNVAQFIYEYSALALPVGKTHPDTAKGQPGCNPEMIEKLNEHIRHPEEGTDPRWDALKNLNKKNE